MHVIDVLFYYKRRKRTIEENYRRELITSRETTREILSLFWPFFHFIEDKLLCLLEPLALLLITVSIPFVVIAIDCSLPWVFITVTHMPVRCMRVIKDEVRRNAPGTKPLRAPCTLHCEAVLKLVECHVATRCEERL